MANHEIAEIGKVLERAWKTLRALEAAGLLQSEGEGGLPSDVGDLEEVLSQVTSLRPGPMLNDPKWRPSLDQLLQNAVRWASEEASDKASDSLDLGGAQLAYDEGLVLKFGDLLSLDLSSRPWERGWEGWIEVLFDQLEEILKKKLPSGISDAASGILPVLRGGEAATVEEALLQQLTPLFIRLLPETQTFDLGDGVKLFFITDCSDSQTHFVLKAAIDGEAERAAPLLRLALGPNRLDLHLNSRLQDLSWLSSAQDLISSLAKSTEMRLAGQANIENLHDALRLLLPKGGLEAGDFLIAATSFLNDELPDGLRISNSQLGELQIGFSSGLEASALAWTSPFDLAGCRWGFRISGESKPSIAWLTNSISLPFSQDALQDTLESMARLVAMEAMNQLAEALWTEFEPNLGALPVADHGMPLPVLRFNLDSASLAVPLPLFSDEMVVPQLEIPFDLEALDEGIPWRWPLDADLSKPSDLEPTVHLLLALAQEQCLESLGNVEAGRLRASKPFGTTTVTACLRPTLTRALQSRATLLSFSFVLTDGDLRLERNLEIRSSGVAPSQRVENPGIPLDSLPPSIQQLIFSDTSDRQRQAEVFLNAFNELSDATLGFSVAKGYLVVGNSPADLKIPLTSNGNLMLGKLDLQLNELSWEKLQPTLMGLIEGNEIPEELPSILTVLEKKDLKSRLSHALKHVSSAPSPFEIKLLDEALSIQIPSEKDQPLKSINLDEAASLDINLGAGLTIPLKAPVDVTSDDFTWSLQPEVTLKLGGTDTDPLVDLPLLRLRDVEITAGMEWTGAGRGNGKLQSYSMSVELLGVGLPVDQLASDGLAGQLLTSEEGVCPTWDMTLVASQQGLDLDIQGQKPWDTPPVLLPIQQRFGPVYLKSLEIACSKPEPDSGLKDLTLRLDGEVETESIRLAFDDLELSFDFETSELTTGLTGLTIEYLGDGLEIVGSLTQVAQKEEYRGLCRIRSGDIEIAGAAILTQIAVPVDNDKADNGTAETKVTSIFAVASLDFPIGGPPIFFVKGILAAAGFHRRAPDKPKPTTGTSDLTSPLLSFGLGKAEEWLENAAEEFPPMLDAHWLAAGIRFSSFEAVQSTAVVSAVLSEPLELGIEGLSVLEQPESKPMVSVKVGWSAHYSTADEKLEIRADVIDPSWVLHKDCTATGGVAFSSWLSGRHVGDGVLTIGGYHPAYKIPSHYPRVDPLALSWNKKPMKIKGDLQLALTPSCFMVGQGLEASAKKGRLSAWGGQRTEALVAWRPFGFDAVTGLRIGAKYRAGWLGTYKAELGADLGIAGPTFQARVTAGWSVAKIKLKIGSRESKSDSDLEWQELLDYLQICNGNPPVSSKNDQKKSWSSLNLVAGIVPQEASKPDQKAKLRMLPEGILRVGTAIPLTEIDMPDFELEPKLESGSLIAVPMARYLGSSVLKVDFRKTPVDKDPKAAKSKVEAQYRSERLPTALWSTGPVLDPESKTPLDPKYEMVDGILGADLYFVAGLEPEIPYNLKAEKGCAHLPLQDDPENKTMGLVGDFRFYCDLINITPPTEGLEQIPASKKASSYNLELSEVQSQPVDQPGVELRQFATFLAPLAPPTATALERTTVKQWSGWQDLPSRGLPAYPGAGFAAARLVRPTSITAPAPQAGRGHVRRIRQDWEPEAPPRDCDLSAGEGVLWSWSPGDGDVQVRVEGSQSSAVRALALDPMGRPVEDHEWCLRDGAHIWNLPNRTARVVLVSLGQISTGLVNRMATVPSAHRALSSTGALGGLPGAGWCEGAPLLLAGIRTVLCRGMTVELSRGCTVRRGRTPSAVAWVDGDEVFEPGDRLILHPPARSRSLLVILERENAGSVPRLELGGSVVTPSSSSQSGNRERCLYPLPEGSTSACLKLPADARLVGFGAFEQEARYGAGLSLERLAGWLVGPPAEKKLRVIWLLEPTHLPPAALIPRHLSLRAGKRHLSLRAAGKHHLSLRSGKTAQSELSFFDRAKPDIAAGHYEVALTQKVEIGTKEQGEGTEAAFALEEAEKLTATYALEVTAPRFHLGPDHVVSCYPPNRGVTDATRLPFVVLSSRTLPWARSLDIEEESVPWLALLMLTNDELPKARIFPNEETDSLESFLAAETRQDTVENLWGSSVERETQIEGPNLGDQPEQASQWQGVELSYETFLEVAPTRDEVRLLSHVRRGGNPEEEVDPLPSAAFDDGDRAVVIGNRLPKEKGHYHALLVSIEGLENLWPKDENDRLEKLKKLEEDTQFISFSHPLLQRHIRLLALHRWSFESRAGKDFQGLVSDLDSNLWGKGPKDKDLNASAPTGHVVVSSVARADETEPAPETEEGDNPVEPMTAALYRGPLCPYPLKQEVANETEVSIGHESRPDGQKFIPAVQAKDPTRPCLNKSLSVIDRPVSFELGRSLALAHPEVIRVLRAWLESERVSTQMTLSEVQRKLVEVQKDLSWEDWKPSWLSFVEVLKPTTLGPLTPEVSTPIANLSDLQTFNEEMQASLQISRFEQVAGLDSVALPVEIQARSATGANPAPSSPEEETP